MLAKLQLGAPPDEQPAAPAKPGPRASRRAKKLRDEAIVEGQPERRLDQLNMAELCRFAAGPAATGQTEHRVSIYMPLYGPGPEGAQNPTRLKNLLHAAEDQLIARGVRPAEARELLSRPAAMTADPALSRQAVGGLAVLLARDEYRCFQLPEPVEESVRVGSRFYIRPLLGLVGENGHYWLLALSQNQVRLFRGTQRGLTEVPVPGLPKGKREALNYDMTSEGGQTHTSGPFVHHALSAHKGKLGAVFHGQGGESDTYKVELERYCLVVDEALHGVLRDETAPLVVACVEYVFPIFRAANAYPYLVEQPLPGNPDLPSPLELHEKAWPLVEPHVGVARREAAQQYLRLAGTPRASADIAEVLPAARIGRVDALLFARDGQVYGTLDHDANTVAVHAERRPDDEDLLETAAIETLAQGGEVHMVRAGEVPGGGMLAAVFRY
jgi:hypothetical protein